MTSLSPSLTRRLSAPLRGRSPTTDGAAEMNGRTQASKDFSMPQRHGRRIRHGVRLKVSRAQIRGRSARPFSTAGRSTNRRRVQLRGSEQRVAAVICSSPLARSQVARSSVASAFRSSVFITSGPRSTGRGSPERWCDSGSKPLQPPRPTDASAQAEGRATPVRRRAMPRRARASCASASGLLAQDGRSAENPHAHR